MNSSKTANMLMKAYNYRSKDKKILLIKPKCDTRGHTPLEISSRAGQSMMADLILENDVTDISSLLIDIECIMVDEAQFLSRENIDMLRDISMSIPVICYGLRTDYMSNLFSGSKRLMEVADTIVEISTVCVGCLRKATVNAKFSMDENNNKVIIREGSSKLDLGSEEKYQPMCWQCWKEG
jgi:thymidine kinase